MIPYTDLHGQYMDCKKDVDAAIQFCLDHNHYITGPTIEEFEQSFATVTGAEAVSAVGSGSMALILALKALGIKEGDEIITTPMTFVATPEAICNVGAEPVFVDVDDNCLIDIDKIEEAITSSTRAILFVDMYGQTPDLERLSIMAAAHGLFLIEDAAHSAGAFYRGEPVGSNRWVDATCFSFNPVKNLGAIGDAGAVTGSQELIDKVNMLRDHGRNTRYEFEQVGFNSRMDCIQAKVLTAKLSYLQGWIERIREVCLRYNEALHDRVIIPSELENNYHAFYAYVIQHDDRDGLQKYLLDNGVGTNIHYMNPCHTQPAYSMYKSNCPKAEYLTKRILSLPKYTSLHPTDQEKIVELINGYK